MHNDTIAALENVAIAAAGGQPTDMLVAVARAAFDVEMDDPSHLRCLINH